MAINNKLESEETELSYVSIGNTGEMISENINGILYTL